MIDKPHHSNLHPTVQQENPKQDGPRQYPLDLRRLTSASRIQTTKTRFSPLQSNPPSPFKGPLRQRSLPLGTHASTTGSKRAAITSLSVTHAERSPQPASPKAKVAHISPANSQRYRPIKDILQDFNLCITDSLNSDIHVFGEVYPQNFEALANLIETWPYPQRKPKLSYHPGSRFLVVEMPSPAHAFVITDFSRVIQLALESLPLKSRRLRISLEHNLTISSTITGFVAAPDLALVATSARDRSLCDNVFAVVECAFSQDRGKLMKKIQDEVEGWPDIELAVAIIVSEVRDYKSPLINSPTWDYFAQCESIFPLKHFLSLPPSIDSVPGTSLEHTPSNTGDLDGHSVVSGSSKSDSDDELDVGPITVAGHTWCDICDVRYCIWVKESGILDLKKDGVTGVLYPRIEMEGVEVAINCGLSAVKRGVVELAAKTTKSKTALRKLQEAELEVKFDWRRIQYSIKLAAERTAMFRYEAWFRESVLGAKGNRLDDQSYRPSSSDSDSSVASSDPLDHS